MARFSALRAIIFGLLIFGLAACRRGRDESSSQFPRSQTLYLGGAQWGEPASFNPLANSPDFPVGMNLMYESLFMYNVQTSKLDGLLAESYEVTPTTIDVTLNAAARWSDGKPVTAYDVKYTFDLGKKYKGLPVAPTWQYITAVDVRDADAQPHARKVSFVLDQEHLNPLVVLDALAGGRIIPKHFIEPILDGLKGDIEAFNKLKFDKQFVYSGPYHLYSYSSEKLVAVRDDNYWGNKAMHGGKLPAPKFIIHPVYKSNDHFNIGLQQGSIDISSSFIPRIWLKAPQGVRAWFDKPPYFPPASVPMLYINVTKKPLGDVHIRRAMGFAISYKDIREVAFENYSDPLKPGLILPFGIEAKYYSDEDAKQFGTCYDTDRERQKQRAKDELAAAGYKGVFNDKGELEKTVDAKGKEMPTLFIKSPTGWSDWEDTVRIVVRGLREVGIDAREKFVDSSIFWPAREQADFDLLMMTPSPSPTPSQPWSRFENVLTSREWAPPGQKMSNNQGRFNNPKSPEYIARIDELLVSIPRMKDEAQLVAAYRELNRIYMQQQPTIPLMYRPDSFYEYNAKYWTGFPNAQNPYLPPLPPGNGLGTQMLWRLTPVGAK
jgi:peptide/nickel transport system substrate-binding protein